MDEALLLALATQGGSGGGGGTGKGIPEVNLTKYFDDGTRIYSTDRYLSFENAEDFDKYFYSSPILSVNLKTSPTKSEKLLAITNPILNTLDSWDHVFLVLFDGENITHFSANLVEHNSKKYIQLGFYEERIAEGSGHNIKSLPPYPSQDDPTDRENYWLGFNENGQLDWRNPIAKIVELDAQTAEQWSMLETAAIAGVGSTVGSESCFTQSLPFAFAALMLSFSSTLYVGGICWLVINDLRVTVSSCNISASTALLNYSLVNSGNTYLMNVVVNENSVTFCAKLIATA